MEIRNKLSNKVQGKIRVSQIFFRFFFLEKSQFFQIVPDNPQGQKKMALCSKRILRESHSDPRILWQAKSPQVQVGKRLRHLPT